MRERIIDYTGNSINPENIVIIHNWEDPEFITPQAKNQNPFARENDLLDRFCVLYSGNIGDNHDLTTIVQAAAHFRDEPVTFVIIGEGDCKTHIVDLAEDLNLSDDTVMFFPFQPLDALPDTLTCADVSVVTVSEGMKGVCVSSKLYTSLAAGEPILVISESGDDEARIVESGAAGIHVEQGNISGVVDAVNTWRQNPERREAEAQNARQLFEQHFTEHQSINRYYQLLHDEGNCQRMRDTHFSSEFT
jgi:glycosyltransferase involved in cell wall biosynthesis